MPKVQFKIEIILDIHYTQSLHIWEESKKLKAIFYSLLNVTGLEWVTHYDILAVLTKSNILPSDVTTYDVKSIFQAVNDAFGVDPAIDCIYEKVICLNLLIFTFFFPKILIFSVAPLIRYFLA